MRAWIVVAGAGALIAIGAPVGWSITDHPTVRQIRPGTTVRLADQPPPAAAGSASDSVPDSPADSLPTIPVSPTGGNSLAAPATTAVPTRIAIPTLSIDAPVDAEGVDSAGEMNIPTNIHTIGWYRWGATPGNSAGTIVMVGHVDSAQQGLGAFFFLKNLTAGAVITVTTADRASWNYHVISREEFPKSSVPLAAVFTADGPPRLILVTCGGAFNKTTKSYYDNIVVTASPG